MRGVKREELKYKFSYEYKTTTDLKELKNCTSLKFKADSYTTGLSSF